tara:strand:- start:1499 stop:1702 length:204 start_codon:yes stop_codon:yes gene_type:complete
MYSYREQLLTVSKSKLLEGDRKTLDCPFCGGRKNSQLNGKLTVNCFGTVFVLLVTPKAQIRECDLLL